MLATDASTTTAAAAAARRGSQRRYAARIASTAKKAIAPRENVASTTNDSAAWSANRTRGPSGERSRSITAEAKMQKLASSGGDARPAATRA